EEVAVRRTLGWTRSPIADLAKVVGALPSAVGKRFRDRGSFCQLAGRGREVVQDPVHPRAHRRVRIVHDKRQTLGSGWRLRPAQRRRDVRAIAGVPFGDRTSSGKSRAADRKRYGLTSLGEDKEFPFVLEGSTIALSLGNRASLFRQHFLHLLHHAPVELASTHREAEQ